MLLSTKKLTDSNVECRLWNAESKVRNTRRVERKEEFSPAFRVLKEARHEKVIKD
jgi:hypothetical protein